MAHKYLVVRGARQHNLKNVNLDIPRDQLVVITGLSGSGKSSLAFDTIYAEGQRRYVESLSAYARQFLGQMDKPDVDQIEGLSPAISIDQKGTSHNPRSTVGTVTEIYDYLRLLYARIGTAHCHKCGREVNVQGVEQIVDAVLDKADGSRIMVLAPLVRASKGSHQDLLEEIRQSGYVRVRINRTIYDLDEPIHLDPEQLHTIEVVVDRLVVRHEEEDAQRLADSVETALKLGEGAVIIYDVTDRDKAWDRLFSEHYACVHCGTNLPELEPRLFSFNSPQGACPACTGLGMRNEIDHELVLDMEKSLETGAIIPWAKHIRQFRRGVQAQLVETMATYYHIPLQSPLQELTPQQLDLILYGGKPSELLTIQYQDTKNQTQRYETHYEGIIPHLQQKYRDAEAASNQPVLTEVGRYMAERTCFACHGHRLRAEALAVTVDGVAIHEASNMPIETALVWFQQLAKPTAEATLSRRQQMIAERILKEIIDRLQFMRNVGLDYLTLNRTAATLSGGESQRIRLATQIGSQLMGCLYILDEPSIGLHQRDNERLIKTLLEIRDLGNTVLVVEHDTDTMLSADWLIDMGPGAGKNGGEVVYSAEREDFIAHSPSLTAQYLRGEQAIKVPRKRREGNGKELVVVGARENNLHRVTAHFPLGKFVCVTGVSGSGKSSLVIDILYNKLAQVMYRAVAKPGLHDRIEGIEFIDKVVDIDQSPIGRTPRSNPATYTGLFGPLREIFASMPESKLRGYKSGRFSFNVKGGRCEACQGDGIIKIEMQFLPDVYVPCEVCKGRRYNRETLQIKYKGLNIAEVLNFTVDDALDFFSNIPSIRSRLETLSAVGLGYVTLGQPATKLSGGEAQRIKLSKELSRRSTGRTLYILDEPTTGLHFADVERLLKVLNRLVDYGNTVLVIEHNLDVIKCADWVLDIGPEGGTKGGKILVAGTPDDVAACPESYTGRWLQHLL